MASVESNKMIIFHRKKLHEIQGGLFHRGTVGLGVVQRHFVATHIHHSEARLAVDEEFTIAKP